MTTTKETLLVVAQRVATMVLLFTAVGCDLIYGPCIYNELTETSELYLEYPDGNTIGIELPPGTHTCTTDANLDVQKVRIEVNGRPFLTLSRHDLEGLIDKRDPKDVGLAIGESGMRLLSESELDAIRGK